MRMNPQTNIRIILFDFFSASVYKNQIILIRSGLIWIKYYILPNKKIAK